MARRNPAADAIKFARLKAHLETGKSFGAFARAEGIRVQSLMMWVDYRPEYAEQLVAFRHGRQATPVTGSAFWSRVEAVRKRKAGARWKVAAAGLPINHTALFAWYAKNRAAVDAALEMRVAA
jgi:hypothetical protein